MNRFTAILAFCMLFTVALQAQANLFNSGDKVIVQISSTYGKVYVHEMQAQQTVYSLSKAFDQRMKDVESVNPGVNFNAMKIGQKIRVPFLAASMVKSPNDIVKGGEYVNVYYKIRPKDNLYRIAKIYFDTSIENLMAINQKQTMDLQADELIKVGWMPIGHTPKATPPTYDYSAVVNSGQSDVSGVTDAAPIVLSKQESVNAPVQSSKKEESTRSRTVQKEKPKKQGFFARVFGSKKKKKRREEKDIKEVVSLSDQLEEAPVTTQSVKVQEAESPGVVNELPRHEPLKDSAPQFETIVESDEKEIDINKTNPTEPKFVYKSDKGIAIWNQSSTNSKNMFALHPTAKVGSYIEITNPMMNKTVQAKVIGNIPPRTYTDDVSIVVSPMVAKSLGVVDRRFAVRVKFREE
ncbi:LysM peptidoglycan-binding domain-containing protein [Portibacter marinus]|uniref:LysM peptidoglycan-binding domain-containing protein n=1 Tax=Portibacter marinus TaxID=2898660 RepID=UPI001F432ECB|nr:LysM peptidoglycan-binding domain-containing protein [Portibacter marinus]